VNEHLAAIAALIQAAISGIHVYDTEVEQPEYDPSDWAASWSAAQRAAWTIPERYVIVTAPTFKRESLTITADRSSFNDYFQVTACGLSPRQCRWVHERVQAALDGGKPIVAGFNADTHLGPTGITAVDTDVDPHVSYAVDSYRYRATPA